MQENSYCLAELLFLLMLLLLLFQCFSQLCFVIIKCFSFSTIFFLHFSSICNFPPSDMRKKTRDKAKIGIEMKSRRKTEQEGNCNENLMSILYQY